MKGRPGRLEATSYRGDEDWRQAFIINVVIAVMRNKTSFQKNENGSVVLPQDVCIDFSTQENFKMNPAQSNESYVRFVFPQTRGQSTIALQIAYFVRWHLSVQPLSFRVSVYKPALLDNGWYFIRRVDGEKEKKGLTVVPLGGAGAYATTNSICEGLSQWSCFPLPWK